MTSLKQIEANRRNALKSTGPTTPEGKDRSRRNAVRHGLTAETVIAALEDAEDYQAFEATVIADYDAETAVERELVLRLASVLWRLRRATGIETAIFESVAIEPGKHQLDHSRPMLVEATAEPNHLHLVQTHQSDAQRKTITILIQKKILGTTSCDLLNCRPSLSTVSAATNTCCGGRRKRLSPH